MIKAMKAFKYIMRINNVKDYMACATSDFVKQIMEKKLRVIFNQKRDRYSGH